jgi:hypothetical protein
MISQVTLFRGEPIASAHKSISLSLCLVRRAFVEPTSEALIYSSFIRPEGIMSTEEGRALTVRSERGRDTGRHGS